MQMIFASAGWDDVSDTDVYRDELRLASQAEDLGFDAFWPVEHHFFDYSFCPDNVTWLSYIAGRHPTVELGTAAETSIEAAENAKRIGSRHERAAPQHAP